MNALPRIHRRPPTLDSQVCSGREPRIAIDHFIRLTLDETRVEARRLRELQPSSRAQCSNTAHPAE